MKTKMFLTALMVFTLLVSLAQASRYQIYSEKKDFWGGKRFLLLDTDTGKSWALSDNQWLPVPLIDTEITKKKEIPGEDITARLEQEINKIKAKQEEEIKIVKAKQEEELKALKAILDRKNVYLGKRESRPNSYKVSYSRKKSVGSSSDQEDETLPPAWLRD